MIAGELSVADIADSWNGAMIHYLALTTEGNFADACMLDGHWFAGLFG